MATNNHSHLICIWPCYIIFSTKMLVDYNPVELAVSDAQQYRGEFMPVKGRLVIYFILTEAEITHPYCKFL